MFLTYFLLGYWHNCTAKYVKCKIFLLTLHGPIFVYIAYTLFAVWGKNENVKLFKTAI